MPARPTICQLLHSLQLGGAEILATRLTRQLAGSYRFVLACLEEVGTLGRELQAEGFMVEVLGRRPGIDWRCMLRMKNLLRRERVDLVHAHQYTPFFYSAMARFPSRRPPILFTEHGRPFPDYPRPKRLAANRVLLGRRDRIVAVGQAVRQALIVNEGIPDRRVEVIYNGIDMTAFSAGGDRSALRHELDLGPDDLVLLQVARLDPYKDHATALRTIEIVARSRPEARLVLVGEGSEEAKIREMIRERGLAPYVRLLGLRTDVARILPVADLFLLTSITEGIPVTLIEAMASSLPVVGTRVGGMGEVVEEGQTGFLAPSEDESSLADAILRLSVDPDLRFRMGQLGAERVHAIFSEQDMHQSYRRCYEIMLGSPTRQGGRRDRTCSRAGARTGFPHQPSAVRDRAGLGIAELPPPAVGLKPPTAVHLRVAHDLCARSSRGGDS